MKRFPVIVSIPHGGDLIPPEVSDEILLSPRDVFEDGDPFSRQIYDLGERVQAVVATGIARAVVDLNRAPDDLPPHNPDGVIKTVTALGVPIYRNRLLPGEKTRLLLERYYFPYHNRLDAESKKPGLELALDCHTMLPIGPVTARDKGRQRPLICLGNTGGCDGTGEGTSCPVELLNTLKEGFHRAFADADVETAGGVHFNDPFSGGYITRRHGSGALPWVQVEINRAVYMDARWFDSDFRRIRFLRERLQQCLAYVFGA